MPLACPEPVYAPNAPVAELRPPELLVLSSLRLWAAPHRDPAGVYPDWRHGCAAAGIAEEGAPAFDTLLRIVVTATRRPLDVRCPRCPHLGEDEAWLLQLVSLLQAGRRAEAEMILGLWAPPAAARMAMLPAAGFAAALAGVGLVVPLRHREAARVERLARRPTPSAGSRSCSKGNSALRPLDGRRNPGPVEGGPRRHPAETLRGGYQGE